MRKKYPTDLSEREWLLIEKYFRVSYKKGGRPLNIAKEKYYRQFFMCYGQDVNGAIYQMIFRHGRQYMNSLGGGRSKEFLKK